MISKEVIIIRHARSNHNIGKTNDLDGEITSFGFKQAANLKRYSNLTHLQFIFRYN